MSMHQCLQRESELFSLLASETLANGHSGTERHSIKVYNVNGTRLSSFEPYSGFLHQNKSAPISSTCFHPHRMMLACSALNDNHINVFSCDIKERPSSDAAFHSGDRVSKQG